MSQPTAAPTAAELDLLIDSNIERAFLVAQDAAYREGHTGIAYSFGLRAAAALIVAAELRRIAATAAPNQTPNDAQEQAYWDGLDEMADRLVARAEELDPAVKEA